jgi:hypothetical protein
VQVALRCQSFEVVLLESKLMEMSNEINSILRANERKDINQEKLKEKIKEKERFYINDGPISGVNPKLAELYESKTYAIFLRKLKEMKNSCSVFALSLTASNIEANYFSQLNQDVSFEFRHGDIILSDLDLNNDLHNEILHLRGGSQISAIHAAMGPSKKIGQEENSLTSINGKLSSARVILSNSTFSRLCIFQSSRWLLPVHLHQGRSKKEEVVDRDKLVLS